jgi:hypothetical protein
MKVLVAAGLAREATVGHAYQDMQHEPVHTVIGAGGAASRGANDNGGATFRGRRR